MMNTLHPFHRIAAGAIIPCLALIVATLMTGCGGEKLSEADLKSIATYTGDWEGQDGTTISIRGDGTGNFESGSTSVSGGTAKVNEQEKSLEIKGLLGINRKWRIDQPPIEVDGNSRMTLDGMIFRRVGGFNAEGTGTGAAAIPAGPELQDLTKTTLLNLNSAIVKNDFAPFYATISRMWQSQTTPDALREAFRSFVEQEINYGIISGMTPVFEPAPMLDENNLLVVGGYYTIDDRRLNFALKYLWEDGAWRAISTAVDVGDAK